MASEKVINDILKAVDLILAFSVEENILNQKKYGQQNGYERIRTELSDTYNQLGLLTRTKFEVVPDILLEDLMPHLKRLFEIVQAMVRLEARNDDKAKNYVKMFKETASEVTRRIVPIFLFSEFSKQSSNRNDLDSRKNEFAKYLEKAKNEAQQELDTAKNVIARLSDQAKNAGILSYTTAFSQQAQHFKTNANWWLAFAIVFFLLIVILGGYLIRNPSSVYSTITNADHSIFVYDVIQISIIRVLIASAVFYGLTTSIKTFRANRHNEILNRHRQNALEAFQAFSNAPSADDQTKNAVLLEATHAIFGHQITGFATGEKDSDMPTKIIETILRPQATHPT
jgi:hypothetical protein